MVDYSKWDNVEMSDEDEEEKPRPRVTRLDQPSKITIGGGGWSSTETKQLESKQQKSSSTSTLNQTGPPLAAAPGTKKGFDYSKWDNIDDDDEGGDDEKEYFEDDVFREREEKAKAEAMKPKKQPAKTEQKKTKTKDKDALPTKSKLMSNGGQGALDAVHYYWSQLKREVTLYFQLPDGVRGKDIQVSLEATGDSVAARHRVSIISTGSKFIDAVLAYPINVPEEHDQADLDWQIVTEDGVRYVELIVSKSEIAGVVLWWKKAFEGEAEIDVTQIAGRSTQKQQEMKDTWKQAQEMFQEKVKNIQPQYV